MQRAVPLQPREQAVRRQRRLSIYRAACQTPDTLREHLRELADQERQEDQNRLRNHLVQVLTAKNNLIQMHEEARRRIANLRSEANLAARRGDTDLSEQLRAEAQQHAAGLTNLEAATARAVESTEKIKESVRRAEERFRNTMSDPDALRAEIEADIAEARARRGLALVLVFALLINVLVALLRRRRHG